ncbi:superoxide dismutase family protein [Metabacillus iocasae]|uniref:Superoxide dismutase [Cu-Zn] n=1 Tax=Priestia iocasae TaxID=2291674 RepID=A0ABS2QRU1_9BACI|nr:superoxide dismutase family protein [Metabacillus iocasae]MBM7702178.1 Cu-Zn family superoxide dismutase [Metabacillus iocasae]
MKKLVLSMMFFLISAALVACNMNQRDHHPSHMENQEAAPASEVAIETMDVNLINTKGETIGEARLTQQENGVKIKVTAKSLPPGRHGFHIHDVGKCEQPDFQSASGHFNPFDRQHGVKNPKGPHAGDLPNIEVGKDGKVNTEVFASLVTLQEGKQNSLLDMDGTSLIIHEKPDDYITDPSGNAGERIACGAIQK